MEYLVLDRGLVGIESLCGANITCDRLCASRCDAQDCHHNPCIMNAIGPMSA